MLPVAGVATQQSEVSDDPFEIRAGAYGLEDLLRSAIDRNNQGEICALRTLAIASSVRSVPFVIRSLNGTHVGGPRPDSRENRAS